MPVVEAQDATAHGTDPIWRRVCAGTPMEGRFMTEAIKGMSRLRKTVARRQPKVGEVGGDLRP